MTWLKVTDTSLTHPKVVRIHSLRDPVSTGEAVVGWVMLASSWSGQHLTDCFIPEYIGQIASPLYWAQHEVMALKVKMIRKARRDGGPGWLVEIGDDEVFHLMLKEDVLRKRQMRAVARRNDVLIDLLLRDGDQCRYCDLPVNPKSSGARGRWLDHVDPAVPDVLVVACRECNGRKGQRTPEQAGMTLLTPATERGFTLYLTQHSQEWLARRNALPRPAPDGADTTPARPGTPDPAANTARADITSADAAEPTAQPTNGAAPVRVADQHQPGRVGPGRAGSGLAPPPATRTRKRGSRGRRGRSTPQPDERSA